MAIVNAECTSHLGFSLVLQSQMTGLKAGRSHGLSNLASVYAPPIDDPKLIENPKVPSQCMCDCSINAGQTSSAISTMLLFKSCNERPVPSRILDAGEETSYPAV